MYTNGSRRELWFIISDLFLQQFPYCIQLGNPISNRREHLYTKPAVLDFIPEKIMFDTSRSQF